jgi:hypothetical protein
MNAVLERREEMRTAAQHLRLVTGAAVQPMKPLFSDPRRLHSFSTMPIESLRMNTMMREA